MDWDDLKIALAVARHGSLGAAARALATTQPTVSRRLNALERRVGGKLFERGQNGLMLTTLGSALMDGLAQMEDGALAVERRLASGGTSLSGKISVTSLGWLGDYVVAPIAARFATLNPPVEVELINDGRVFNLSRREADIAFRFGSFEQEDLIFRKVADAAYGLYASAAYLERHGPPDFEDGCRGHAILLLRDDAGRVNYRDWMQQLAPNARVILRTNGVHSHVGAVAAGLAMAALPRAVADRRPDLRHIATPLPEPVQPIRMGFHADMRDAPRIRAFIDFAVAEFTACAGELSPAQ